MSVYTVFIDALKPESLEHMKFLNNLSSKPIKPDFINFSNTCQASMYTGVYPNKHGYQFIWTKEPASSPFRLLHNTIADTLIRDKYTKYLIYNLLALKNLNTVPYGFLFFAKHNPSYWANFSFEEVSHSGRPDHFIGGYPTIFELIDSEDMEYNVDWHVNDELSEVNIQNEEKDFNYYYFGHVDPVSHKHGQDSDESIAVLQELDSILEGIYSQIDEDDSFIVLSDHGHVPIENFVDLSKMFKQHGDRLSDYVHFLDSCYARFWPRSNQEREEIIETLKSIDVGEILTESFLREFNSELDDDVILFYLSPPNVFDVVNPQTESMHGFDCRLPDSKGVFVANSDLNTVNEVQLQDLLPTILTELGVEVPDNIDGENVL